jgi:hypothetical protein
MYQYENTCSYYFDTATQVKLTPVAAPGSVFKGWGGHADCADSELFLTGNRLCTAYFEKVYLLTVTQAGRGIGSIRSYNVSYQPTGIYCSSNNADCTEHFSRGTSVLLVATPEKDSAFETWSGDCKGTKPSIRVNMKTAKSCTAHFTLLP